MHKYLWAILLLLTFLSCRDNKPTDHPLQFGNEPYDSAALHIALIPNRDCLPIYYASRTGLFDSLGVKVQIASYPSQMDCDTALLSRLTDGGYADLIRLKQYGKQAADLQTKWSGTNRWELFVCGTLRVKDTKSLKGRTVAVARESTEYTYLQQLLSEAGIPFTDVYKPQINSLPLRAKMLSGNQIDASVLCWPHTSMARAFGHRRIAGQSSVDIHGAFVVRNNQFASAQLKQKWTLFEKGRRMAQDSLRLKGPQAYTLILQKDYGLPQAVADTVKY